ncbi:MAG: metal-dependent hydrolase [Planctomycetes bacterium]|nr:metal-dependent hydrolase [Planctomycetota bacterium]
MVIDVNAYLGEFAFRRLHHNTADGLLRLMDRHGIDKACVSSANAITYRNCQPANKDLAEATRGHRGRLIPFAVVNPTYADWQHDLRMCHDDFGMVGIRMYPGWHGYAPRDGCARELAQAATELGMIVSIPIRVEDPRERHWLVDVPDVSLDAVADLMRACPNARFMILEGIGFPNSPLGQAGGEWPCEYLIEISRLSALLKAEMRQLIEAVGAQRLAFGSGMPFKYPAPALLKLEVLDASDEQKDAIRWRNAEQMLESRGAR